VSRNIAQDQKFGGIAIARGRAPRVDLPARPGKHGDLVADLDAALAAQPRVHDIGTRQDGTNRTHSSQPPAIGEYEGDTHACHEGRTLTVLVGDTATPGPRTSQIPFGGLDPAPNEHDAT